MATNAQKLHILVEKTITTKTTNNDYDIFIVDTHRRDISGFEVARKIRDRLPHKK